MDKATAELDGTIVFNYIDDDIEIIETAVTEKEPGEEPRSDTSFDENQNPKVKSECIVEKTNKTEKDLIILLANEVLIPIKLEPSEETTSLQSQNSNDVGKKSVRKKRARSSEITKPPKHKKVKTKDTVKNLKAKKLKDSKKLETPKPKRGRLKKLEFLVKPNKKTIPRIKIKLKKPKLIKKGLNTNKQVIPKIIIKIKHIKPKQTKKGIKAKQQYAVVETVGSESYKPKRGRPKKQLTTGAVAELKTSNNIKKNSKQDAAVTDKALTLVKVKKHRSKSLGANNLNASQVSKAVDFCIAKELVTRGMELKQLDASVEMTKSQLGNINGTSLEPKQENITVESKDFGLFKPKRGRPAGSKNKVKVSEECKAVECPKSKKLENRSLELKQTNSFINTIESQSFKIQETFLEVEEQSASVQFEDLGLTKCKKGRSKSLETKKVDVAIVSNASKYSKAKELKNRYPEYRPTSKFDKTRVQPEQQNVTIISKALEPSKPKRGRPKSLGSKKMDIPVLSNILEAPKAGKPENVAMEPKQLDVMDLTKMHPSKIVETLLEAKQQATIVEFNDVESSKPISTKFKVSGTKKVGDSVVFKSVDLPKALNLKSTDLEKKQLDDSVDLTKPQSIDIKNRSVEPEQPKGSMESNSLEAFKPKRGRPKGSGSKKIEVPVVSKLIKPSKVEELNTCDMEEKQMDVPVDLTKSQPSKVQKGTVEAEKYTATEKYKDLELSKSKKGRSQGSRTKKVDGSVLSKHVKPSKADNLKHSDVETNSRSIQLDASVEQASKIDKTRVEAQQDSTAVKSIDLGSSKPKRGRPKGSGTKKLVSVAFNQDEFANKSIAAKQLDAPVNLIRLQTSKVEKISLKQQNGTVEFCSKLKRGRPKGFKVTKHNISVINKDLESSNSRKAEIDLVTKQLGTSLVISDVGNGSDSSKARTLKALGLEAKQKIPTYLVPSKGRRLRAKILKPKDTLSLSSKNLKAAKTKGIETKSVNTFTKNIAVDLDIKQEVTDITKNNLKTSKPEKSKYLGAPKLVVAVRNINMGLLKPKRGRSKGLLKRKINPLALMVRLEPLKLEEIEFTDVGLKETNTSVTSKYLGPSQPNMVFNKCVEGKKVSGNTAVGIDLEALKRFKSKGLEARKDTLSDLGLSKTKEMKNKGSKEKQLKATVETIDLEAPKAKRVKDKADNYDAVKCSKLSKVKETANKGVRATQVDVFKKITSLIPKKPKKTVGMGLQSKRLDDIVEIVDLQPPNSKAVIPKGFRVKKVRAVTIESRPSTSNGIVDTVDLDLSIPKNNKRQNLGNKKINVVGNTKDSVSTKVKDIMANNTDNSLEPSQDKDIIGKRKRRDISFSGGNKDFVFPKPKRFKRSSAVVATNDAKPSKSEETDVIIVEQEQDDSVGRKEVDSAKSEEMEAKNEEQDASVKTKDESSKLVEAAVTSLPKKSMCTVGTQTIEIPDDEVKGFDTKSSVGTEDLESCKPKEDRDTTTVSSAESALPKANKTSESDEKNEKVDESVKTEEDNLNSDVVRPIVAINITEGNQEHGVKYESVEQIHTEFKYESQSEHEEMRKRRGKLGGPMRGRRRRPKMEETTINSFVRIIDLNGKIQLKCYNQIFKCEHCLYVGNSKANLDRHSLVHRNPDEIIWFQCTECPYRSKYEHQLKSHFLIHLKPDQIHFYQCPHCDAKCSRKHNLTNHIRSIHASREYTFRCAECDYTTFSKERLVAHLRKHSKEVHACTQCKFVTKRLEYLKSHFKMKHVLEAIPRPFPCDTCSYKGKTKRELDKHYDRMHNKEQLHVYQCNHCAFNSIYKKNLEFHLLHMHNNSEGFQKFICGHCQKSFSYKNGLKVHIIRCHLQLPDEEWHKCHECKYKSKDVSTLKRHIKRNHGAPRLHCKLCSFATNRQVSMEAHVKTHEYDNEDILKCPECPYRIIQMSSFLYHMKVIHGKPVTSKEAEQYYMQDEC